MAIALAAFFIWYSSRSEAAVRPSLPGLEPLAAEADTLVQLLSGRPQLLMPLRIRVR